MAGTRSVILFLSAWLVGWAMGEFFAARQVFTGGLESGGLFLIAWLAMWTVGGCWAIYSCLWLVAGSDVIRLRPGILAIKRDVFGTGRTSEYDVQHVRNLRVSPTTMEFSARSGGFSPWGTSGGSIAFDYGSKTVRFGAVEEAEAAQIIADLKARQSFSDRAA